MQGLQHFIAATWHNHIYLVLHCVAITGYTHTYTQTHLNCKLDCHTHSSEGTAHVCLKLHTKQAWHVSLEFDGLLFTWKVYWSKSSIRSNWPTNKTRDVMHEMQTIFLSAFKIHVYTAYTAYTASSSWYVFRSSPRTVVFNRRRETRRMLRALRISHRNTTEENFFRWVWKMRIRKREHFTEECKLLTERHYNKGSSAKVSRRCSWTLCCVVDGYYCCMVDRHCFFSFIRYCRMYCM